MVRGKHDREHPYVMISKEMLRDQSISPQAKGVLCFLLSHPDNWKTNPCQVADALGVGIDRIYSSLDELMESGYCRRSRTRKENGQWNPYKYEYFEEKLKERLPQGDFPHVDEPHVEKPDRTKDIEIKKNEKKTTTTKSVSPSGDVVVSSSLEKNLKELPGMTSKLLKKSLESHTKQDLQTAYFFAMAPNVIKRIAVFQAALEGKWVLSKAKINPKELAMKLFEDDKEYNKAKCQLSNKSIAFHRGLLADGVDFDEPQFLVKFRKLLDKFGIQKDIW